MNLPRSILLQLDAGERASTRLDLACAIAAHHDAALSAMFVGAPSMSSAGRALVESPAPLLQPSDLGDIERAQAMFEQRRSHGGPAMRWLDAGGVDAVKPFCEQALYADLLVLGQHDEAAAGFAAPADFIQTAVLGTGRPALIVPRIGTFHHIGRDVLIGWNARPEAARAVTAALPWLRDARRVHVLEAITEHTGAAPGLDLAQYLGLHGVQATIHRHRGSDQEAGETLLSMACDVNADLLVMGFYGHSRARELVMGGASRSVLRSMTVPVLMVH